MKANEQTLHQVERAIRKIAQKFPQMEEPSRMTDIHIRVTQETGELTAFDDDDNEITRCIVEQWIDNKDDNFYEQVTPVIRRVIDHQKTAAESLGILKPYSFVLEDDDKEPVSELYVVDDDLAIMDTELMAGLDKDLNEFFEKLLRE